MYEFTSCREATEAKGVDKALVKRVNGEKLTDT